MTLASPHWLLLLVPAAVAWWLARPGSVWLAWLRGIAYGLIVLAMCEPRIVLPERAGTVVVLADRSASMPADAAARQLEMIGLVQQAMSPDDRLAVVSFGEKVAVEQEPAVDAVERFEQAVGGDASDLAGALRRALALIPADGGGRVLVLGDGRYTGTSPGGEAALAAARGIAIDHRELSRPAVGDLAVVRVNAPESVQPGEAFMLTGWVDAASPGTVDVELYRGDTRIAATRRDLPAGLTRLTFRDRAAEPGALDYRLQLVAAEADPIPENDAGRFIVGVEGDKPLLVVTDAPGQGLANLLRAGGLSVQARLPGEVDASLTALSGYSGVVLENVALPDLPAEMPGQLAALVPSTGTGLLMTGGQRSFGPGGYYRSPLDPLLPVSMELRQEHRKLSLAIVVALDRSGSMAMTVAGGRTKMDLANLGTAEVVDLLGPMDELGVLAVDSAPHQIVALGRVDNKEAIRRRVLSIESMGGGIYIYEALAAAAGMLADATPQTRHIILFADAQDSEEPGRYATLLKNARRANITVSVIGLGKDTDVDAPLLKDVASLGGGRAYFTEDPAKLPQLFAQDTFVVARSSFIEEPTAVEPTGALVAMTGRAFTDPPAVGGYNLNYLKPDASPAMVTRDEYAAPLLASWQAGLGRVATYAGEADGKFTGPIAGWAELGELFSSLARWVAAGDRQLPDTLLARQRVDEGRLVVELLLDPERPEASLTTEPRVTVLFGRPGTPPQTLELPMRYTAPDTLAADVPLAGSDVALATLDLGPTGRVTLPPTRLLYSPEYLPQERDGSATLKALAATTRGTARADLASIWDDLVPVPRAVSVAHWLWLAAVAVLLIEVLERRTAWVSQGTMSMLARAPSTRTAPSETDAEDEPKTAPPRRRPSKRVKVDKVDPTDAPPTAPGRPGPARPPTADIPPPAPAGRAGVDPRGSQTQGRPPHRSRPLTPAAAYYIPIRERYSGTPVAPSTCSENSAPAASSSPPELPSASPPADVRYIVPRSGPPNATLVILSVGIAIRSTSRPASS